MYFDKRDAALPIILTKLNDIPEIVSLFRPQKVLDRSRLSTKSKTNQRRCGHARLTVDKPKAIEPGIMSSIVILKKQTFMCFEKGR